MFASLILASVLAAAPPAAAQTPTVSSVGVQKTILRTNPFFRTLGVADGLPSSEAQKIAQDHDGFIWIGTHDGLARYDGVGFRIYRHDPADPTSILSDDVGIVMVDRDNRIWCGGANSGLNMLDSRRSGFVHYPHDAKDPSSLGGADIWSIAQSDDGAIWAGGASSGVDRMNADGKTFTHFRHDDANPDSPGSNRVFTLHTDGRGRLWIGHTKGLDLFGADGHFHHVDFSAIPGEERINAISILDESDSSILVATRRGVVRVDTDLKASVVANSDLADVHVMALERGSANDLWIGTQRGLNRRSADGHLDSYLQNTMSPGALPSGYLLDIFRDREGGMWFTTIDSGIAQLPPNWQNFSLYRSVPGDTGSLSSDHVRGLAEDRDGHVWAVNADGGIDRLDPQSGRTDHFAERWKTPGNLLESILVGRDGQIWVGHIKGIRVYDRESGKFVDFPTSSQHMDELLPGKVDMLVEDFSGSIWARSFSSGIDRIDPDSHRVERFDPEHSGLRGTDISQIGLDPAGNLLAAMTAGLDRFDADQRHFSPVPGMMTQHILEFAFAANGTLWVHAIGALEHYDYGPTGAKLIEHIDSAQGWPTLSAGGMQIDPIGNVWVTSPRGLWRFDPATRAIRRFDTHDGLASSEFTFLPMLKRRDGSLFGSTNLGIVGFQPENLVENTQPAPLVLDAVVVRRGGRDVALDTGGRAIELQWNDHDLRLRARALSYVNPAANRYQWQLSGFDSEWTDTGSRGEHEYSQLPPGRHRLKLRAANANGVWTEISPLVFDQPAPPWATRWAYAAYMLALAMAAWLAIHSYRKRLERRHIFELAEQQRQFAESANAAKTNFLATMGHEIRTPMTGVLGMTELLLRTPLDGKQRSYAEAIQSSGQMMLRLVNDSLDLARIEAGKLELEDTPLDLHALVEEVAALTKVLAQRKNLDFAYSIAADAPRHVRGDAVRIKQIFLNLSNNAIKFTERGRVHVELARDTHDVVRFCVRDTGPGIAESTRRRLFQRFEQEQGAQQRYGGSGLGLAICRELVARMDGDITLDSVPGEGSTFRVTLPLQEIADTRESSAATAKLAAAGENDEATARSNLKNVEKETNTQNPETRYPETASSDLHILLVEDDATVAAVVRGLLEAQGHHVRHVGQGLAALGEIEIDTFDVALLDLDLPGIDGLALARAIRSNEAGLNRAGATLSSTKRTRLPLIAISARSVGDEEALCVAAGMDAFLRKPLTGTMLSHALARAVRPS